MRTELESGAWIEHRPIQELKAKDKDAVQMAVRMLIPITADGEPDFSDGMAFTGAMQVRSRNAALASILKGWSFDLPLPVFEFEQITHEGSIGELPIDDINEIEDFLAPYLAKLRKKPNPKGATTSSSNGSSRAKAAATRKA